jgi:gamma-glutamyltranspeptidase/glutathione hydrolase
MPSNRAAVVAPNGVVAAAHPLATLAGMRMLLAGGNAIDAAVAVASTLNVVEPSNSGIGGDGYMMISLADGTRKALDFVGRAPSGTRLEMYKDDYRRLLKGPLSALVPGACGGWLTALETYGTMDRATVFAPAIEYAENGFALTRMNSASVSTYSPTVTEAGKAIFQPKGQPLALGEKVFQRDLAQTFRAVVEGGADAFYRGPIAKAICSDIQSRGGVLSLEDMAAFTAEWVDPISVTYRGYEVATLPPPCCGIQYLETLNLLEGFDIKSMRHGSADHVHTLAEAMKIAVADRVAYVGRDDIPTAGLLSKAYAERRRREIDPARAHPSRGDRWTSHEDPAAIKSGDLAQLRHEQTTSFSVIDRFGNAVTVSESIGDGFGSGVCAPGTGVFLNDFAAWFDLDPQSPNVIGPGRRVAMCVAPCHVYRDGRLAIAIGTPGGLGILQTTLQMLVNLLDYGMDIQEAIEAPRFRCIEPVGDDPIYLRDPNPMGAVHDFVNRVPRVGNAIPSLMIESRYTDGTLATLAKRGHKIERLAQFTAVVGGGHGAALDAQSGIRYGGADPRRDGVAIGH